MERRKQIEIEEQEIRRKEKELMSTVKLPAESEAYKVQTIAEGKRSVYKSTTCYGTRPSEQIASLEVSPDLVKTCVTRHKS